MTSLIYYKEKTSDSSRVDKLYKQLIIYYQNLSGSFAKFCILFFKICYENENKLFEIVILSTLYEIIKDEPNDVTSVLNTLKNFKVFYAHSSLFKILIKSLNEYKLKFPDEYPKVIGKLVTSMELLQEKNCKNLKGFEIARFNNNCLQSGTLFDFISVSLYDMDGFGNDRRLYSIALEGVVVYVKNIPRQLARIFWNILGNT
ncbi:MAG TPA: hypothetical protein VIY08_11365 [Candidatus Nitrosocosmicus sp.]